MPAEVAAQLQDTPDAISRAKSHRAAARRTCARATWPGASPARPSCSARARSTGLGKKICQARHRLEHPRWSSRGSCRRRSIAPGARSCWPRPRRSTSRTAESNQGLRPIDPQHDLMPEASRATGPPGPSSSTSDWTLAVTATATSWRRSSTRASSGRWCGWSSPGPTRSRSRPSTACAAPSSGWPIRLPEEATIDVQPRINGKPIALEKGQPRATCFRWSALNPEQSFLLEIALHGAGRRQPAGVSGVPRRLRGAEGVPGRLLAAGASALGPAGPWTEEFDWRSAGSARWQPCRGSIDRPPARLGSEGGSQPIAPAGFPTDGRMYLFSTLPPEGCADEGALRLTTAERELASRRALCARGRWRGLALGAGPVSAEGHCPGRAGGG